MKKTTFILTILLSVTIVYGQDGNNILAKIDKNMSSDNRIFESTMTIKGKRSTRTLTSKSWAVGNKKAFTEYLSPVREQGTKMLKLDGQLWIYTPSTDRTVQIAGHMLRQSVMGSDLSYEDMLDDRKLQDMYNAKIVGSENIGDRKTTVLELNAKVEDVAYAKIKMWVDAERFVALREELYAKSGQLLKKMDLSNVKYVDGRWFPMTVVYKDMLKEGNGTEFTITSVKFNQQIPDYIFSKASLKQ